jgi:HK97 family phage major capsid protein
MPTVARRGNVISTDHMWTESSRAESPGLATHLLNAGFQVKTISLDGRQTRQVFSPQGRPFADAFVYEGAYSEDRKLASYQRKMRQVSTPQYARAFWSWPGYIRKAGYDPDLAFALLHHQQPNEAKALSEGIDAAGGFWVPPDFVSAVLSAVSEQSLMILCSVRPTSSDTLHVPRFLPPSTLPSVYSTQMPIVAGASETPARPPNQGQTPGFGLLSVPVRRFRSIVTVSRDALADAAWVTPFLQGAFARDLGPQISNAILNGDTNGGGGILTNQFIPSTNLQSGAGHALDNSSDDRWRSGLKAALPEQYRDNAIALMHGSLQAAYESETPGANNRAVLVRHDDVRNQFLFDEVPMRASGLMPAVPTSVTSPVLLYGDLAAGCVVANRADASMSIITESVAADFDALDVVFVARVGTAVLNPDAFRMGVL